jgi:acylphosphatase
MQTRHLKISGRVQGVGFRYYVHHHAQRLGLTGWVRNCRDGSVEAVVQGNDSAIAEMIAAARRGPRNSAVSAVDVSDAAGSYDGFEIRPTA